MVYSHLDFYIAQRKEFCMYWGRMKYFLSIMSLLVSFHLIAQEIKVNSGSYSDYYHIKYELTSGKYSVNTEYGLNKGGNLKYLCQKSTFRSRRQCAKKIS